MSNSHEAADHSSIPTLRLGIVGGGRAAWAFGSSWNAVRGSLSGFVLRPESMSSLPELLKAPRLEAEELMATSDVVLLAVSDTAIEQVGASLSPLLRNDLAVFHASGSLSSEVLPLTPRRFSLHPLRALPPAGSRVSLSGALLVAEGSDEGLATAHSLAATLRGRMATIQAGQKPAYHAAAVFASNYVAVMLDIARRLMNAEGIDLPGLESELGALAESAIGNWESQGGPERFTGPASRGDLPVLKRHLAALGPSSPLGRIYSALARELISAENHSEAGSRAMDDLRKWLKENG
ncbi:MAG: DUF2520 domain-containing protein [Acidobacteriota bacterium]